jgi:hypothetical protein
MRRLAGHARRPATVAEGVGREVGRPKFSTRQLFSADFPNHASARDLHQEGVVGADKMGVGTEVPDGPVIDDISAPVWPEPDIGRAVERGGVIRADERLIAGVIPRKILEIHGERLVPLLIEVHHLYLMAHFGSGCRGVRRRKTEIAFKAVQRRARSDGTRYERSGCKVDPGERRVRRLARKVAPSHTPGRTLPVKEL